MTDAVIIHLASRQVPGIDVLFLDTGYHFAETIGTRDAVSAVYPVNLINVTPPTTVAEQDAELGPRLYSRNPDLCCYLRKVVPAGAGARPLRRLDHRGAPGGDRRPQRHPVVEWDPSARDGQGQPDRRVAQKEVDDYIAENGVLVNPLVYDGYPSIGCRTCTVRVEPGADPRSGRWAGTGKTECGMHI